MTSETEAKQQSMSVIVDVTQQSASLDPTALEQPTLSQVAKFSIGPLVVKFTTSHFHQPTIGQVGQPTIDHVNQPALEPCLSK